MGTKCGNMTTDLGIYRDAVSTANSLIIMKKGNLIEKQQICMGANSAASSSKFLHFKSVLTILALCLCMVMGGEAWGQEVLLEEDFESGMPSGWYRIDNDGDSYGWDVHINTGTGNYTTHSGDGSACSESYSNDLSQALHPDNWLITPRISLPASSSVDLNFFVGAQDENYPYEHYGVYISTSDVLSTDNFILLGEETLTSSDYVGRHYDLSAYAGQNVYIAFRHWNVSDQFILLLDDVSVICKTVTVSVSPIEYTCGDVVTLTASFSGGVPAGFSFHWYSNAACTDEITTGLSGANNSILRVTSANGARYYCRLEGNENRITNFQYTGGIQTYTVPEGAASLKLEVWGAQGGRAWGDNSYKAKGGLGGYSVGNYSAVSGSTLYVVVGGKGNDAVYRGSVATTASGGYNGGGGGSCDSQSGRNSEASGAGGGATHIAKMTGTLNAIGYSNRGNVLIVAGGGGGGSWEQDGGAGGGTNGGQGANGGGSGGTQTTGYLFGLGATGSTNGNSNGVAGGGGGWYGGQINTTTSSDSNSGGGGSGYIGGVTAGSTTAGQQEGNGKACITAFFPKVFAASPITLDCGCRENPNTFQFASSSQTMNIGDVATYAATNNTGLTVTYSSGNTAIATVNLSTGEVHALSDGTVTIYASIPEVPASNYCEKTISYTLTVSCTGGTPSITFPAEYNSSTQTITYIQGSGIKYPDIRVNGAVLPSSAYGDVTNTGGADIAVATGGVVRINTARAGSAHISLYVPAVDGFCSTIVDFDVVVTCTDPIVAVSFDGCSSHSYNPVTNTYELTYEQNTFLGTITNVVMYNGSNQLPSVATCGTDNPYVANLINGTGSNRVFRIDVSKSGVAYATLRLPANGNLCEVDDINFVINVECTPPAINYTVGGDGEIMQTSPIVVYQYYYESGATPFALPIEYPGQTGYTLPEGTRFRTSNTTLSYMEGNKIMINRGGVGTASMRLIIPATGNSCQTIVDIQVDVKYPCLVSQDNSQIGDISGNTSATPIADGAPSYTQQLYRKNELGLSGVNLITRVSFKATGLPNPVTGIISMYMGETSENDLSSGWIRDITKVVANKSVEFHNGWIDIELERPFLWEGTGNLVVGVYNTEAILYDGYFNRSDDDSYSRFYSGNFSLINKTPYANSQSQAGDYYYYRPIISLCATKQYTLKYYAGSTCGGAVSNIPEPQIGKGLVTIPSVTPICSSPGYTFVGWSRTDGGTDYILPGGSIDLVDRDVELYAVFRNACSGITVVLNDGGATPLVVSNDTAYYKACYGNYVQLNADISGLVGSDVVSSCRWSINAHDGEEATVLNGQSVLYYPEEIRGNDCDLFVVIHRSGGDCVVNKHGRIKVGGGLTPSPDNYTAGEICLGKEKDVPIGASAGSSGIQVTPLPIEVTANLGQTDTTFIPDGPYCLDECYTSSVTFYDFEPGSTVTSADNIELVRINMEHSFIADLQIKLTCPDGRSVILLQDMAGTASGGHDDDSYDWPSDAQDISWGGTNWNWAPIGFGYPSRSDGNDICNVSDQAQGTGADYCWSESLENSHYAAGTNKYVYESANLVNGGEYAYKLVKPSDMSDTTQVYKPRQHFSNLIGCPLNGTWTLSICDYWDSDNGYIFNWEVSLKTTSLMNPWNYTVEIGGSHMENMNENVETYTGSNLNIRPINPEQIGAHTSYLVMQDNLGCDLEPIPISYNVSEAFHVNIMQPGMVCVGQEATLSANPTAPTFSYEWKPTLDGSVLNTTATYRPEIYGNSSYVLVVEDSNAGGCKSFAYADVNIKYPAAGSLDGDFVWSGVSTDWNADNNWFKLTDATEGTYTLQSGTGREMPSTNSNVFVTSYYDCVSDPTLNVNATADAKDLNIGDGITIKGGSNSLNVAGDMIFNGTADFAPETGTVKFVGSGDQTITKSNEIKFNNVVFNQGTAGHTITADNGITINGAATFTKGIVDGDVTFGNNASATANTYESYVDGTVTKSGSANGFTFPTGSNGVLGKVTATSDVSGVSVRYHNDPDGFGLDVYPRWWNINDMCSGNTPQFDHVSNFEYWDIATTASLSATLTVSSADGSAHFNANTQTHDGADVYGAFWNGNCWKNIGGENHSVSANPYGTITVDVSIPATRAYSKIVSLGSQDHSTVLPIELTALTATCDGRKALVEWTTASERNNDYFSLEHSDDAINFTEIARIAGAGNNIVPLDYSYTDYGVHGGDNYYRLVQVDYDGTRTASEIVVANCIEASGEPEVLAYPNPFSGDLTVELENFGDRPARIDVYDMLGRLVYTEEVGTPQNSYQTVLHFGNLPDATYTVRVGTADFVINRKVVKQQ